jgi:hypothetical protein
MSTEEPEPTLIYRAPLRSGNPEVDHERQVAYALKEKVVGPGWGLKPPPRSIDRAVERLRRISKSGADTVRRFADAPTGSLVWSRDLTGRYLLGQLVGEWRYDPSPEAAEVDLANQRQVRWARRSVLDDEVPAAVVRAWAGRGTSFHRIHNEGAQKLTVRLYDQLTGKQPQPLELTEAEVVRDILHPLDVEDLICVFLQVRHNYIVLPGSHRSDTPAYEQVLISRDDGHRAIVQVKSGDTSVKIGLLRKAAADDARAFAYSTTGRYSRRDRSGISVITEDELLAFAREHEEVLPARVRRAFEYSRSNPGS